LSNNEFFNLLGIPELTNVDVAHAKGLPGPLIAKRDGCHVWKPESFASDDPRHGWTWDDCRNDAVALMGSEEALERYLSGEQSEVMEESSEPFLEPITYTPQSRFRFGHLTPTAKDIPQDENAYVEVPVDSQAGLAEEEEPYQLNSEQRRSKKNKRTSSQTTDRHVALIVRMIEAHRLASKTQTLGSVKAEKISHLVESHLGFDLGRNPVRDVAGPVDFPHFKKVCHRAKMKYVFDTEPRTEDGGVSFIPMAGLKKELENSVMLLGKDLADIDEMIQTFVKFDSDSVEIVATLYAAWNDLLADQVQVSDDKIIEAFYRWDASKLKFNRERLTGALEWMRAKNLIPSGRAKRTIPLE
jgi:hypothetical protein